MHPIYPCDQIIGEPSKVAEFYKAIPEAKEASTLGTGLYTVPCKSIPEISLTFAGKTFPVTKETFSLGAVEEGSEDCVAGVASAEVGSSEYKIRIRHSKHY